MGNHELVRMILANNTTDLDVANRAVQEFEEETLNQFVSTQYSVAKNCLIEVEVSDEMQKRLFDRIQQQWAKIGEIEPYASVLSDEKFSMNNIAANLAEFRSSGKVGIDQLKQLAKKNNVAINFKNCLELGCGVGRMTAHFADSFEHMLGIDISPGNLRVCEQYLEELNLSNTKLQLLSRIEDLETLDNVDAFVSFIAIQHNPPPIQKHILQQMLSKLNYGGVFLFQTIVHHPSYSYTAQANFKYPPELAFEMHCLPMRYILKIINDCKLTLLDVAKDRLGGYGIDSCTFFGINLDSTAKG